MNYELVRIDVMHVDRVSSLNCMRRLYAVRPRTRRLIHSINLAAFARSEVSKEL